jgi:endoglucanase
MARKTPAMARNLNGAVAWLWLTIAVAAVSGLVLAIASSRTPRSATATSAGGKEDARIGYGAYDPEGRFSSSERISVDHVFLRWDAYDRGWLRSAYDHARARNRWLMVTIEPWTRSGDTLFDDITAGVYDKDISPVCADLGSLQAPLFVRWGHEMEDVTGRYPWARDDADGYIRAYRYFVDHCRKSVEHGYFVWSPVGKPQMSRYYPGSDYVDYVGLSVYGLQERDFDRFGPLYFDDQFRISYTVASVYGKPVMITELGIQGDEDYRRVWLAQLEQSRRNFPLLRLAVYFNAKAPEPLPGGNGMPDWRIDPCIFPKPFIEKSSSTSATMWSLKQFGTC